MTDSFSACSTGSALIGKAKINDQMEILKKLKMAMTLTSLTTCDLVDFWYKSDFTATALPPSPPWLRITFTSDSIDSFEVALLKRHDDKQGYTLD